MNHRMAVPLFKTAKAAWDSESRIETYLAVAAGIAGAFLLVREVRHLMAAWETGE